MLQGEGQRDEIVFFFEAVEERLDLPLSHRLVQILHGSVKLHKIEGLFLRGQLHLEEELIFAEFVLGYRCSDLH